MSLIFSEVVICNDGLMRPAVVAALTPTQAADLTNGCGPQSMKIKLIPDTVMGIDFFPACAVHDQCYSFGEDEDDKRLSDRIFLFNLLVLIDKHCAAKGIIDKVQRVAARSAAFDYFKAVSDWGRAAFYAHKGQDHEDSR